MHGVQIVNQCFHCLISSLVRFLFRVFPCKFLHLLRHIFRHLCLQNRKFCFLISIIICQNRRQTGLLRYCLNHFICKCHSIVQFSNQLTSFSQIFRIQFPISFCDSRSHSVFKVRNRLTAVLIILIRLNGNTSQCGITANIIWFP